MTQMIMTGINEVEGMKFAVRVLSFVADRWLAFSRQGKALTECQVAAGRCETQKRALIDILTVALAALLIGSMFYTAVPRSRI